MTEKSCEVNNKLPHDLLANVLLEKYYFKFYRDGYYFWHYGNKYGLMNIRTRQVGYVKIDEKRLKSIIGAEYKVVARQQGVTKGCDTGVVNQVIADLERDGLFDDAYVDPNLIYVENGVLDIKSRELIEDTPNIFLPYYIPWPFDKKAVEGPTIDKLFDDITRIKGEKNENGILTLEEFPGYALEPDNYLKKFMFLKGPRDSGKTTYLNLIKELFGSPLNAGLSVYDFNDKFMSSMLEDKFISIRDEVGSKVLTDHAMGIIREISGGEQEFTIRHIRSPPSKIFPRSKFLFACNDLPSLVRLNSESTKAFIERAIIQVLPNKFPKNRELPIKLRTEMSYLLNKILDGKERLREQNEFSINKGGQGFNEQFEYFREAKTSTKIDSKYLVGGQEQIGSNVLKTGMTDFVKKIRAKNITVVKEK